MSEVALSSSARMDCIITFKILFKKILGTLTFQAFKKCFFEDDYHKVCWNVGLMSQQQPYSGLHPPRRSHSTYVSWNDSWAHTIDSKLKQFKICIILHFQYPISLFLLVKGIWHTWLICQTWAEKRLYRYKTTHPDIDRPLHVGAAARWTPENLRLLSFS